MLKQFVFAGFGGQGILTAGMILAHIGSLYGKEVIWMPSYGSEMRGGTANCSVKISDEAIASPFIKKIDYLIARTNLLWIIFATSEAWGNHHC